MRDTSAVDRYSGWLSNPDPIFVTRGSPDTGTGATSVTLF